MNVSKQNTSNVSAVITLEVTNADYQEKVDKTLRSYRQKANIPGFRQGMAPKGMIQKMYGKHVLVEEINKLVGEKLYEFIRENNLNVLGEPLPSKDQAQIDFEAQKDFTISFDVALAPEFKVELSKDDKIDYYTINVSDDMVAKQIESMQNSLGTYVPVEEVSEKDMLKGDMAELDEAGNIKEGGIVVEGATIMPTYFKNEAEKAKFNGAKKLSSVDFNPSEAVEGNQAELASTLKMKKEEVEGLNSNFRFTINEITHFTPATVNEEFFKNVLGNEDVKTEEGFKAKVKEMIATQLAPESDYKFAIDAREALINKVGELEMPVEILKRWLLATGENRTEESVEQEMPKMLPELIWHLIKEQIVKDNAIKVEEADINDLAARAVQAQLAQYGMTNVPAEMLENYVTEMKKNKDTLRQLAERATEDKIIATIKGLVSLNAKEISSEDFYKMFEKK